MVQLLSPILLLTSWPVLNVCPYVLELCKDLCEEARLRVDPEHWSAQPVDDVHAAVPEAVLVRLDQERLQGVADLVAHVTERKKRVYILYQD
jgi:hypothetical protein